MADNVELDAGSGGAKVATDAITYSGETADVQVTRPVLVTGSEGSKTLREYVKQDDTAFTPGTDAVAMIGAEVDDTAPDSVDEGDAGAVRMSANRNLHVRVRDDAGNERGMNIDANGDVGVTTALDTTVSGSEVQVDVVGSLPAGTNAIGKLAANSGVDIGDTDVTSVVPGTAATNLGKAEDAAHSTGDVGVMSLSVRNDVLAPLAGSDGDYTPPQVDALGATYVNQGNRISADGVNSRAKATLAASATFQGTSEDVSGYGRVGVSIVTSNATDGVLTMEVSRDNVVFGGPSRSWADTRFAQPHMWNIVEKYFRIKYVNGTTEALNLQIQVQYSNNANILLGHQLDETLLNETEAIISRSVAVGQDPNNTYVNEGVSGVDDNNSSTTNLTSGTSLVFTGAWSITEGYHGITVLLDGTSSADVSGTLLMQFSHDGSTVHRSIVITTAAIANTLPRTLGVVAKYFRIVYTSDADLLSFDAQTMLHTAQVHLVSRADSALQGSEDVQNVRAVLTGLTGGGSFVNIKASNGGALKIDFEDIGGNSLDVDAGNSSTGTQRVTIATDDINLAAIKVAVEILDNIVSGSEAQVDVITQPARVATTDNIGAALMTNVIHNGTTALTPKFANLSTASTGNQALVAAVSGKKIRILALQLMATASTNAVYINDATGDLYGDSTNKIQLDDTGAAGLGGFTLPFNPLGWFETAGTNRPVNINLGSTNGVIAIATYVEV